MNAVVVDNNRVMMPIFQNAVWLYILFALNYRDVADSLAERGIGRNLPVRVGQKSRIEAVALEARGQEAQVRRVDDGEHADREKQHRRLGGKATGHPILAKRQRPRHGLPRLRPACLGRWLHRAWNNRPGSFPLSVHQAT